MDCSVPLGILGKAKGLWQPSQDHKSCRCFCQTAAHQGRKFHLPPCWEARKPAKKVGNHRQGSAMNSRSFFLASDFFFWYGKPTCSASLKLMRCSFLGGTQHGYFMYVVCVFEEAWGRCDILRGLEDSKAPSFSLPEEWDQAAHASLALQNSVLLFQSRKELKWLTPAAVNCVQHSLCW